MEGRWIQALKEHGTAYGQCKEDIESLRRAAYERLGQANPDKPHAVATIQGEIKALTDLLNFVAYDDRKESHARGQHQQLSDATRVRAV